MSATRREKACFGCAESKRRCDKQRPECQRCLDRDIDCHYPQPKRRRRDPATFDTVPTVPMLSDYSNSNGFPVSFDILDWDVLGNGASLNVAFPDVAVPNLFAAQASEPFPSAVPGATDLENNKSTISQSSLWFLQDHTWIKQHATHDPACVSAAELEPFVQAVEEMLSDWVKTGRNSFIHHRLYEHGMPACLQDAFTTLAAYNHCTVAVKDTILQIAQDRSSALACQDLPPGTGIQNIRAHLARVQALFIHLFMLLFDGSVLRRASAEQHIPMLRQWLYQMWEAANKYRCVDGALIDYVPGQQPAHGSESQFTASVELWHLWILTESVRRTHIIFDTVANIYEIMSTGMAECVGGVMFTARRGLWEAESAARWFDLCYTKQPLLVPSLRPHTAISEYPAEDFDDFAKLLWKFIVGKDTIQSWVDTDRRTSGV